jgi:methylated-DNA-protein-cysteine methyltransferase-like protein
MKKSYTLFTEQAIAIIGSIPIGKVMTYGDIASACGSPGSARQVARLLHSLSRKHKLPWFRVVNARGRISLPRGGGYETQKSLLESEGILFNKDDSIDFNSYRRKFK